MLDVYQDFVAKLRQLDTVRLMTVSTKELPSLDSLKPEDLSGFLEWVECSSQLRVALPIANAALDAILRIQSAVPSRKSSFTVEEL